MARQTTLPVYQVEFIPVERRLTQRRDPFQQYKATSPTGERRATPGRRQDDWASYNAAGLSLAS